MNRSRLPVITSFVLTITGSALAGGRVVQQGEPSAVAPLDDPLGLPTVLYVDATAPPGGDGLSWATAFSDLQDAITEAEIADGGTAAIHVAGGVYTPTRLEDPGDPRSATFRLVNGVAVRGGYAGRAATRFDDRNLREFPSILTGDLAGDDDAEIELQFRKDNAYHVATSSDSRRYLGRPILDGFILTRGQADGSSGHDDAGGGLLTLDTDPVLVDCTFIDNHAYRGGGAAFPIDSTRPRFVRCVFESNFAAELGGGLYFRKDNRPELINCAIRNNVALEGGGLYAYESIPLTLRSCVVQGNEAIAIGGGIYWKDSIVDVSNLTLVSNVAEIGGGIYALSRVYIDVSLLNSSIVWANKAPLGKQVALDGSTRSQVDHLTIEHCVIEGGAESITILEPVAWTLDTKACLSLDPQFAPVLGGGFHLSPGSPCIDSGDPAYVPQKGETDIDGNARRIGGRIDIGADEFVPPADLGRTASPGVQNVRAE